MDDSPSASLNPDARPVVDTSWADPPSSKWIRRKATSSKPECCPMVSLDDLRGVSTEVSAGDIARCMKCGTLWRIAYAPEGARQLFAWRRAHWWTRLWCAFFYE